MAKALGADGWSYFHIDFAHSQKEFKHGWKDNEPRRQALLADLAEIIWRYASRKFGWVVENELFAKHAQQEDGTNIVWTPFRSPA
jgi:hypothetical protein